MSGLFRAYGVAGAKIPTYFIESTAPDNVDDSPSPVQVPSPLFPIDPDTAVDQIAKHLSDADDPNLVVMVHGFNNPQPAVLRMYAGASNNIENDAAITARKGLVCVGYRWPSEQMGAPLRSSRSALPTLPRWIFWLGVIIALCGFAVVADYWPWLHPIAQSFGNAGTIVGHFIAVSGLAVSGLILCALLLRIIVYFRDNYRATNYGAPDLIEIIRQVDHKIIKCDKSSGSGRDRDSNRVQLSFVGHSMGGYVVTNAIRVLSDLFASDAIRASLNTGTYASEKDDLPPKGDELSPKIGDAFSLMRFVLASPDIPAEALLSNRANFLSSSLRRFHEAYLFSNEGDEVLRQVSTLANYFSFPTKSSKFGFRLGNVEILKSQYGFIPLAPDDLLSTLRVGHCTLKELYEALRDSRKESDFESVQDRLPKVFSYFDCTDYVEPDSKGVKRGVLTFALRTKRKNPKAGMRWWSHVRLLLAYVFRHQNPDVHGGYFKGALSQQLMFRLACLGFHGTAAAFGNVATMSAQCEAKQIRALLSPLL